MPDGMSARRGSFQSMQNREDGCLFLVKTKETDKENAVLQRTLADAQGASLKPEEVAP